MIIFVNLEPLHKNDLDYVSRVQIIFNYEKQCRKFCENASAKQRKNLRKMS